jgi:hypothetical protein
MRLFRIALVSFVVGLMAPVLNTPAAHASGCLVTIMGGSAGQSYSCSSWATGFTITVANGAVAYKVTCYGVEVRTGTVTAITPRVENTPYGCEAVLTLTSTAADSYAVGFLG